MENFQEEISSIIKALRETTEQLAEQNERFKAFLDAHGLMTEFESLSGVNRAPGTEAYHREVLNFLNSCKDSGFSEEQLEMLKTGISGGLGLEGIVHYADKTYSVELMDEIRLGLLQTNNLDKLPGEYRELLKDIWRDGAAGVFNKDQISVFREMIVAQYPLEDIKFCKQSKFNYATLRELSACLQDRMNIRELKSYKPRDIHAAWYEHKRLSAVAKNGMLLRQYKEEQTSELCKAAVRQDGFALQFVKEQTPQICLEAVKQNGIALQYVKEQTSEICLEAVKQNGFALGYVEEQTPEICLEAVKQKIAQNELVLGYVKEQTPEICLEAVKRNGLALVYVKEQTPEIQAEAVKQNKEALQYVKKQKPEERQQINQRKRKEQAR